MPDHTSGYGHEPGVAGAERAREKRKNAAILLDKQGILEKSRQHQKEEVSVFSPE
jgi:hypothetical protein